MGHTIRHEQKRLARARRIPEQAKATEPALNTEAAEQLLEVVKT